MQEPNLDSANLILPSPGTGSPCLLVRGGASQHIMSKRIQQDNRITF